MKSICFIKFISITFLLIGVSQNGISIQELQKANKIELLFLKGKKHLTYLARDANTLDIFKRQIKQFAPIKTLKCDSTGVILYFKDSKVIGKMYFSTHATGSRYISGALTMNSECSLFIYDAGRYIDEIYYKLNK